MTYRARCMGRRSTQWGRRWRTTRQWRKDWREFVGTIGDLILLKKSVRIDEREVYCGPTEGR